MTNSVSVDVDFIEELRLRRWARENYVSRDRREETWHPVIHDEMAKKETEAIDYAPVFATATTRR